MRMGHYLSCFHLISDAMASLDRSRIYTVTYYWNPGIIEWLRFYVSHKPCGTQIYSCFIDPEFWWSLCLYADDVCDKRTRYRFIFPRKIFAGRYQRGAFICGTAMDLSIRRSRQINYYPQHRVINHICNIISSRLP